MGRTFGRNDETTAFGCTAIDGFDDID